MYTENSMDLRLDFIKKRIDDWSSYYRSPRIKSDKKLQMLLTQDLDVYGIPENGDLDSTNGTASNFSDDSSNNSNIQNTSDSSSTNTRVNTSKKNLKTNINTPKMALVDVAIIRTEEIYKSSKGVNLLNGLNLFFSGDDSFFIGQTLGKDNRVANTTNNQFTIKLGTNAAGLNYSLNIFNDNYDRNEVIARPTILVQDNQKSSFFSGGTMHIVLEGGVAGSGSIEPIDVGVTLEVKPKFLDSETININVLAQRTFLETALSGVNDNLTGTSFAQTSKTKIQANLTLKYGETMVLSGLSDQEKENIDDKVPLVGDLPVIQYLFRNNTKISSKRTVLILLTPRQATLSYDDGESMNPEADVKTTNLTKLEGDSWMKPSPNLKGIVSHLSKYDFFNQFRKGDIMVENWAGEGTIYDVINRTLEYF
jgi:Flp pilus assembly secretin CpaC